MIIQLNVILPLDDNLRSDSIFSLNQSELLCRLLDCLVNRQVQCMVDIWDSYAVESLSTYR